MKNIIFLSLIFLINISCNSDNHKNKINASDFSRFSTDKTVEIEIDTQHALKIDIEDFVSNEILLSDIYEDIDFVFLDDDLSNPITSVDKVDFDDNYIYLTDWYNSNSITIFDRVTGKLVNKILPNGEGPREYTRLYDVFVNQHKNEINIFDGDLRKHIVYTYSGDFIRERRLPYRIGKITIFEDYILNYTQNVPNDHLGLNKMELVISDSLNNILALAFPYQRKDELNEFYGRNYFSKNDEVVTISPRFKNQIYQIDRHKNQFILKEIIDVNLGRYQLDSVFYQKETESFLKKIKKTKNLFFGNGHHFVTDNWIYFRFDNLGKYLELYHNKKSNKTFVGKEIKIDFGTLIFPGPISAYNNQSIAVGRAYELLPYKKLTTEQWSELESQINFDISKFKNFIMSLDLQKVDNDTHIAFIYKLKS